MIDNDTVEQIIAKILISPIHGLSNHIGYLRLCMVFPMHSRMKLAKFCIFAALLPHNTSELHKQPIIWLHPQHKL